MRESFLFNLNGSRSHQEAELDKVPYMLIVGGDESENGTVSLRKQGEGDVGGMTTEAFAERIESEVREMLGGDR